LLLKVLFLGLGLKGHSIVLCLAHVLLDSIDVGLRAEGDEEGGVFLGPD
jgi:hypothetical protein